MCYVSGAGLMMAMTMGDREMELLAEKVLQKLAQSRSDDATSPESPTTADGGMETAPEPPSE